MSRRRKVGAKRIEIDLGSTLFPKFSPQPRTHRGIQSWVKKRKEREEIEETWGRKRRVKRGRQ